jgi:hypothetical protein
LVFVVTDAPVTSGFNRFQGPSEKKMPNSDRQQIISMAENTAAAASERNVIMYDNNNLQNNLASYDRLLDELERIEARLNRRIDQIEEELARHLKGHGAPKQHEHWRHDPLDEFLKTLSEMACSGKLLAGRDYRLLYGEKRWLCFSLKFCHSAYRRYLLKLNDGRPLFTVAQIRRRMRDEYVTCGCVNERSKTVRFNGKPRKAVIIELPKAEETTGKLHFPTELGNSAVHHV